jgi:hypothetical protein
MCLDALQAKLDALAVSRPAALERALRGEL